ncbi:MAG TPA: hypothetical protein VKF32_01115, partial [Thermoanaerobaculia bacterium]|nr:hypothetical protein [Thermoanaerobaculia bacterium]
MAVLKGGAFEGRFTTIRLPKARVFLKALPSGNVVAASTAITNPHGYFIVPSQPAGRYTICAEATGFAIQCDSTPVSISSHTIVLTHYLMLSPDPPGAVVGRVLLKNGSPCFHEDPAFATLVTSQVSILGGGGGALVSGPITANSYGQFVVPKMPGPGTYTLSGECALGTGQKSINVTAAALAGTTSYTLTLDNSAPTILSIVAVAAGAAVRRANVGATLQVTVKADDPDGDTLHYRWASATPGFASVDSATVNWTLPNVSATNAIYVEVSDRRGGFANERLALPTGGQILFTGTVLDRQSHSPVVGAEVNVGAAVTHTNAGGVFLLSVPETARYVMNVKKPTFALVSQVFLSSATGLHLFLDKSARQVMDPREGGRGAYKGRNSGATVIINARTLVDSAGNSVTTPVNVDTFAYDLEQSNPIPGDLSGKDLNGKTVRMETYGALDVQLADAGGNPVKLAAGATAAIAIDIPAAFQASAPASIPLLSYDQATGLW